MSSYQQGATAGLQAQFLDHPSGGATDPTSISLSILDTGGATVAGPWVYPGVITRTGVGTYLYSWVVPSALTPANYTATWTAVIAGSTRTGFETITVTAGASVVPGPQAWATTADVQTMTGQTVSGDVVTQAQTIIEMLVGRTYVATSRIGSRDIEWLKRAVVYQAAWLLGQPDAFQRMDLQSLATRGRGLMLNPNGITVAPMAKWALKRVSWLKSRSLHVRSPYVDGLSPMSPNAASSANDFYENWSGFDGGVVTP